MDSGQLPTATSTEPAPVIATGITSAASLSFYDPIKPFLLHTYGDLRNSYETLFNAYHDLMRAYKTMEDSHHFDSLSTEDKNYLNEIVRQTIEARLGASGVDAGGSARMEERVKELMEQVRRLNEVVSGLEDEKRALKQNLNEKTRAALTMEATIADLRRSSSVKASGRGGNEEIVQGNAKDFDRMKLEVANVNEMLTEYKSKLEKERALRSEEVKNLFEQMSRMRVELREIREQNHQLLNENHLLEDEMRAAREVYSERSARESRDSQAQQVQSSQVHANLARKLQNFVTNVKKDVLESTGLEALVQPVSSRGDRRTCAGLANATVDGERELVELGRIIASLIDMVESRRMQGGGTSEKEQQLIAKYIANVVALLSRFV
jgi:DNA repair exonuclease SbcCD ATPase subunit